MNSSTLPLRNELSPEQIESLKGNAVKLAQSHRETCPGEGCTVSLMHLGLLLEAAGIELSKEEWHEFF